LDLLEDDTKLQEKHMFNKLRKILTRDEIKTPEYQQIFSNCSGYVNRYRTVWKGMSQQPGINKQTQTEDQLQSIGGVNVHRSNNEIHVDQAQSQVQSNSNLAVSEQPSSCYNEAQAEADDKDYEVMEFVDKIFKDFSNVALSEDMEDVLEV
jgi:hypothetical protein